MFEYNLRIFNATKESSDLYECTDLDRPDDISEKAYVFVIDAPDVSIVYASQNPMREEADFSAECQVIDANPEEIVDEYWISPGGNRISDNASLLLKNVSREMSGEYTCVMSNVFHNGVKGNGTATVEVDVQYLSTVNMTVMPSLNVTEGEEVTIVCEALNGNPDPHRLQLLHKGNIIDESDDRKLQITFESVNGSHSGIYQCNAYTRFYDGEEHSTIMREIVVNSIAYQVIQLQFLVYVLIRFPSHSGHIHTVEVDRFHVHPY
ncbi:limbic system-associated membrane protein-like [Ptychodera flava]|uniref:limbic system-associated membrane protein-like n=1 Tax=Ptychodera flava TaxID=63121 RepID=UPI00396A21B9